MPMQSGRLRPKIGRRGLRNPDGRASTTSLRNPDDQASDD
ncbi:hypothetical protein PUR_48390 [Paenibacillus sp. URB8-2]|nr:hypothetical protein PUR_48390 [Paenibacillus sp. URB8-2]